MLKGVAANKERGHTGCLGSIEALQEVKTAPAFWHSLEAIAILAALKDITDDGNGFY